MTAFWNKTKKQSEVIRPKKQAHVDAMPAAHTVVKDKTGKPSDILIRPILTEKGTMLESHSQYVFEVKTSATKPEVRKAVKHFYGVNAVKVNMVNVRGRNVRFGAFNGTQKKWKKAMVTLKSGEKIELYKGK